MITNEIANELELQQIRQRMDSGVAGGPKQKPLPQTTHHSFEVQAQVLLALYYGQRSLQLAELQTIWTLLGDGCEIRTLGSCRFAQLKKSQVLSGLCATGSSCFGP